MQQATSTWLHIDDAWSSLMLNRLLQTTAEGIQFRDFWLLDFASICKILVA